MKDVIVDLVTSTICFLSSCHPALLGENTPKGVFSLQVREVAEVSIYGKDVLQFKEDDTQWFAIHRVIKTPKEQRIAKLNSPTPARRRYVTHGCINVSDAVYEQLRDCCSNSSLLIR